MVDSDDSGDEKGEDDDREAVAKEIFEEDEDGDIDRDELDDLEKEREAEGLLPAADSRRERQEGGSREKEGGRKKLREGGGGGKREL